MPNNNRPISLNPSATTEYLLGNPPTWMMHYGISAITVVLSVLLALSYFIAFPDTVEAKVKLVTANPPIRLMAKASGRVLAFKVQDKESVSEGQLLAVLENTANWQDVLRLESILQEKNDNLPENLQLGELQNDFSTFAQHRKDFAYYSEKNGVATKINYLQQQIEQLNEMNENLKNQLTLSQTELSIAEKEAKRQHTLYTQGVASQVDVEKANASVLQNKKQIESSRASIISNRLQVTQLRNQINDLHQNKNDKQNDKNITIEEDLQKLRAAIANWKSNFLVIAPIAGQVSLAKVWSPQQNVMGGEEILAVVPTSQSQNIIGKATMPVANSGKVSKGMKVNVQLDAFPYQQHGALIGEVQNISLLPEKQDKEEEYLVEITFPQPLTTSYHQTVPFRQEMIGKAFIITENRSILSRIFDKWHELMEKK